ncbi:MAG TPA: FAD:protein FMN transferase [Thermodesulfobacteriota bacterium]|nr:FAD:protein FMN transferase [Thermodesulfobacteriota bacterium]
MKPLINRRAFIQGLGLLSADWAVKGWAAPLTSAPLSSSLSQTSETLNLMGTFVTVTLFHSSRDQAQAVLGAAFQRMDALIRLFNRHDRGSAVSVLNERGCLRAPPPELVELLDRSRIIHSGTRGLFDVTIKPVLDLYELGRLPSASSLREALTRVGTSALEISPQKIAFSREGMGITLDGIAKGTIVDETIAFIRQAGIRHALVDAGGDLRVIGGRGPGSPWRIAVYDPLAGEKSQEVISIREGAIATSGNYMVYFDREKIHHHILSPESGTSPAGAVSATVAAPSAEKADALATALMLLRPVEGRAFIDRQERLAVRLQTREGEKMYSAGWPQKHRTRGGKTVHV